MRIVVASKNPAKVDAVKEILREYPHLKDAKVESVSADGGVEQPRSLDETVSGAIMRAHNSFNECDYSIGLESGLMPVPKSKSGYMDVCVCSIFDGTEHHMGLSSAWESPDKEVTRLILEEGMNMSDAAKHLGKTENEYIGWGEGLVGVLTKGRLDRKAQTKEALRSALIHLEPA